jgi:hypothetical protein
VSESVGEAGKVLLELPFDARSAREVDFSGRPLERSVAATGRMLRFNIRPWEVVTLAIRAS